MLMVDRSVNSDREATTKGAEPNAGWSDRPQLRQAETVATSASEAAGAVWSPVVLLEIGVTNDIIIGIALIVSGIIVWAAILVVGLVIAMTPGDPPTPRSEVDPDGTVYLVYPDGRREPVTPPKGGSSVQPPSHR